MKGPWWRVPGGGGSFVVEGPWWWRVPGDGIEYPLGGSSKKGSHVYFLLHVFWVILLLYQIVLLFDINVVLTSQ